MPCFRDFVNWEFSKVSAKKLPYNGSGEQYLNI